MRDHPRSRGVYSSHSLNCISDMGSSPLARGLRCFVVYCTVCCGIIPARAGFTGPSPRGTRGPWDHPRSRGVYRGRASDLVAEQGSSPLARGLPRPRGLDPRLPGIIPARAGFTRSSIRSASRSTDHPRSRGVYSPRYTESRSIRGSSPLARGLRQQGALREGRSRIIPARAGFTSWRCAGPWPPRDHPRSRGVYAWRSLESQRSPTLPDGFRLHC